jgi:serine/threonine protein kinase
VSALARCHSGLKASRKDGLVYEYTEFEPGWQTILHRDIKPGNGKAEIYHWLCSLGTVLLHASLTLMLLVLLASRQVSDITSSSEERGGLFVTKLGDFGTSFQLEKDGKSPSTHRVGTRPFWAPVRLRNFNRLILD